MFSINIGENGPGRDFSSASNGPLHPQMEEFGPRGVFGQGNEIASTPRLTKVEINAQKPNH